MNKMDEVILVAKREAVLHNEKLHFNGVISKGDFPQSVKAITNAIGSNIETMRRGDAEENYLYKQPIPYAVVKRGEEYYGYTRLQGGGESRLHGKISLGIGGHMNEIEGMQMDTFNNVLLANLQRELEEEVLIGSKDGYAVNMGLEIIGLINDDADDVGRVHIGILAFIELSDNAEVTVRETEQLEGRWYTKDELKSEYERLENWSKFVVDTL